MATMKIKKGDTVRVIAGADKDNEGKVIAVNQKNHTVLVEGVNMIRTVESSSRKDQSTFQMLCFLLMVRQPELVFRWTETRKSA